MKLLKKLDKTIEKKYPGWDVSIALRYLPIAEDINSTIQKKSTLLDVGSGGDGIATYLRGYKVTGTDIDESNGNTGKVKIVKASADNLPFADKQFDVVTSVDMMEHLPPKIREKAVAEMVRVAKKKVYIEFPRGELSKVIDLVISKYYKFTHKKEMTFLKEHIEYGLPDQSKIVSYISTYKHRVHGNTNSLLWFVLLLLGFSENKYLTNLYRKLLLFIPILKHFHFWPTYRVLIVVEIDK